VNENEYPAERRIVGRPNVGKSALFNRLAAERLPLFTISPESRATGFRDL